MEKVKNEPKGRDRVAILKAFQWFISLLLASGAAKINPCPGCSGLGVQVKFLPTRGPEKPDRSRLWFVGWPDHPSRNWRMVVDKCQLIFGDFQNLIVD